ncbi:HD domain-containing protein [Thalassobaculum sp. OXR-137]|uniref:HD domain-containing protein n=1 Tax=Thalassobaculum sp. OXR-137 TaxID=3100173 RepID=UPI002AC906B4|nr:HD domain-containing protein [Thalassobaculum sp. OXR-137]WPZ34759.1 HD domain-containing protein [Thalassobaculum sp. OXR-137]
MQSHARTLIDFLAFSERLKRELRHSWLSDGRRESVAEHSWQMALMAILVVPHLRNPVDLLRVLEMIVVHDLTEAAIGDIPAFEAGARQETKRAREAEAATRIRDSLDPDTGRHVFALFLELETGGTSEAKLVHALDRLEVQIQHNLAPDETWEPVEYPMVFSRLRTPCAHDPFLAALAELVEADGAAKLAAAGVDVAAVRRAAAA